MLTELANVASFIVMFIVMYFVIKIYLAVKVVCERRAFQVQALEGQQRARHGVATPRRAAQRNRRSINLRAAGNRTRSQEHDERLCQVSKRAA